MERVIAVDVGALESLQDVRNSLTSNVCVCVCCSIILRSAQSQRSLLSTTGSSSYLAHS